MSDLEDVESTHKTRIPAEAFGGTVPDDDALRFYRLIEERRPCSYRDGEDYELACGHEIHSAPALPRTQEYAFCEKCKVRFGCR